MKATENDNSDKNSMIVIEIEKNPKNHKHGSTVMLMKLHFNQWDLTVRVILICPSMQVTQKTTPDGTKRGLKWKKRATAGKTAREWTDENLISYSDKLSQSAQAVVKAMTVQGSSSS